jgi:hypothetical protein
MIVRWLMVLSEFSFKVEFIAGVDNGIADSMLDSVVIIWLIPLKNILLKLF